MKKKSLALSEHNNKTSTDTNGISIIIKKTIDIRKPLTTIFNMSFENGVFSSSIKVSKIIPIFKNSSKAILITNIPVVVMSKYD